MCSIELESTVDTSMCLGLGQDFHIHHCVHRRNGTTGCIHRSRSLIFLVIVIWHVTDTLQFEKFHHTVELREDAWGYVALGKGSKLLLCRHLIKCWRINVCSKLADSGLLPKDSSVAYAIANNPQS